MSSQQVFSQNLLDRVVFLVDREMGLVFLLRAAVHNFLSPLAFTIAVVPGNKLWSACPHLWYYIVCVPFLARCFVSHLSIYIWC